MNKVKTSKFLSLILRHQPERVGITLSDDGWALVADIVSKAHISSDLLKDIVETDEKKRYSFSEDGKKIRANQGHSIKSIDLKIPEKEPPEWLYHGTSTKSLDAIYKSGILKQSRQYVHLSDKVSTAYDVGKRRCKSVAIFTVGALQMHQHGIKFYLSENGIWLTDHVAPTYLVGYDIYDNIPEYVFAYEKDISKEKEKL